MAFSHITFTTHCNTSITFVDDLTEPQGYVVIKDEDQQSTVYITATEKVRDDLARIVRDWNFAEEAQTRGEDVLVPIPVCDHCGMPVYARPTGFAQEHDWAHVGGGWACEGTATFAEVNGTQIAGHLLV